MSRAVPLLPRADWDPDPFSTRPVLASLAAVGQTFRGHADFPTVGELSTLLNGARSAAGATLVFERQTKKTRVKALEQAYDARIYLEGRIPTRERSWHDLFNAYVWATFPKAKRAVNERQYIALAGEFARDDKVPGARTKEQDALAMLDEGGILLVSGTAFSSALNAAIASGDVDAVGALVARGHVRSLLFGHALAEHVVSSEALVRGLPVCLQIDDDAMGAPLDRLTTSADSALETLLAGEFARETRGAGGVKALPLSSSLFPD